MSTLLVFVGSKTGVGALPGMSSASSRKFRPLSGSDSMRAAGSTPSTTVLSGRVSPRTTTPSWKFPR